MNQLPKYVTPEEVQKLIRGAKKTKHPLRNELIILMLYNHGLRETELCRTRKDQIKLEDRDFQVERIKNGKDTTHPLTSREIFLIGKYEKYKQGRRGASLPYFFVSSWGTQFTRDAIVKIVHACAVEGGITHKSITPHMLRHGCGYKMINIDDINPRVVQDYLGHRNIENTVKYTELSGNRFKGIWE